MEVLTDYANFTLFYKRVPGSHTNAVVQLSMGLRNKLFILQVT
jgi:hypothetical protein